MADWLNTPVVIIAAPAVAGVVWNIARWVVKVDLSTKDWARFTEKGFPEFAKEIREDVKQILLRLPAPSPVASASPVQLTEFGRKIAAWVEADK